MSTVMTMDHAKAKRVLETLANGTDPATGEVLPESSPYNDADVIRALFFAARQLQITQSRFKKTTAEKQQENISKGRPKNTGLPWDNESREYVTVSFRKGASVDQIAAKLDRTRGSIIAELKRQGLVSEEAAANL
ncbi:MAG: hypothetical protein PHV74_09950 [Dehalococcoidia bacterium]|nr:hypothetical protein [Dehalococcoidia bacterium]